MFKHIIVPTDFSDGAAEALNVAVEIAKKFDAQLTVVHACEPPTYAYMGMMTTPADLVTPIHDAAREALKNLLTALRPRYAKSDAVLRSGVASVELLAAIIDQRGDLVVMATHGRTGVPHLLLGSVAERLVRSSPVPVLTIRKRK